MPEIKDPPVYEQVRNHLFKNGIKKSWAAKECKINRTEFSRKLKGDVLFTSDEILRINKKFKTKIKLNAKKN